MSQSARPRMPKHGELASIKDAAERYGLHNSTIRRRIPDGSLTAYKMGRRILRVDLAEVEALFQPVRRDRQAG
jgi:excisionase family DNA binding protein